MRLNLINQIDLCEKVRTAAGVNVQHVQHLLLGRLRYGRSVEIHSLLDSSSLELLQCLLIATPLVCNQLATLETAYRDDHSC